MYEYYFIKNSTLYSQGWVFTHATKKTEIIFIPSVSIADSRFYNQVAEIALNRECIVDQQKISHPAYLELYDHLLFETDFQKLLQQIQNFPFYKKNQQVIAQFTSQHISPENKLIIEDVNKIINQVHDTRLPLVIEIAKASLYDSVNQQLLNRVLAEELHCASILSELFKEAKKRYSNWQFILINLPKNTDLANTELILDADKLEYYNQFANSFFQTMLQYVEFMVYKDVAAKRRAYGEFIVELNEILNNNSVAFESVDLNMNLQGQVIVRFIENCLSSQKKGVILMGGLSGPSLEIVLKQRGLNKIGKIDPIPILEFK